jgi:hypothetical protein
MQGKIPSKRARISVFETNMGGSRAGNNRRRGAHLEPQRLASGGADKLKIFRTSGIVRFLRRRVELGMYIIALLGVIAESYFLRYERRLMPMHFYALIAGLTKFPCGRESTAQHGL